LRSKDVASERKKPLSCVSDPDPHSIGSDGVKLAEVEGGKRKPKIRNFFEE
jgi:hypothetical protein